VVSDDIPSLVAVARQELRQSFIDAGLGISGANIAIANTGTIVIVSNEGNARLVTTLPPVHVAVIGIEKTVSTLAEATKILEILPPSATGQKISSYVSFITGPSRTADIECSLTIGVHGPKEMHIVLLDNGRNQMRDDPVFREALYCIKCAACLNVCPTYQAVGGHVFGYTYAGGIGAILTAFLNGLDEAANLAELCLGCGACLSVCPAKIDIPRLVLALRERIVEAKGITFLEHVFYDRLLPNSRILERAHMLGRVVQRPLVRRGLIRGVPFSGVAKSRSLPALAARSLGSRVVNAAASQPATTKVAFYSGCLIEHIYPEIGEAVLRVLENHGVSASLPKEAPCCGAPARHAGDRAAAVAMAKRNITVLEDGKPDYVIVACPTCGQAFIHDYPQLLAGDPVWEPRALKLAARTVDFTRFVAKVTNAGSAKPSISVDDAGSEAQQPEVPRTKITYHDPCHLKQHLGISEEPRAILKSLTDYEYVEMAGTGACCGFGGSFSLKFPEASGSILARRLADVEASGADIVVTACPGCVMQLRGGIDKRGMRVQVTHLAEVLAKGLDGRT
jgi:Fe-S oxidoreductase